MPAVGSEGRGPTPPAPPTPWCCSIILPMTMNLPQSAPRHLYPRGLPAQAQGQSQLSCLPEPWFPLGDNKEQPRWPLRLPPSPSDPQSWAPALPRSKLVLGGGAGWIPSRPYCATEASCPLLKPICCFPMVAPWRAPWTSKRLLAGGPPPRCPPQVGHRARAGGSRTTGACPHSLDSLLRPCHLCRQSSGGRTRGEHHECEEDYMADGKTIVNVQTMFR